MFTGTTAFLQVRHTETSPLPATEPGVGRPPTGIGTETMIGITGIGTEIAIGTVIEIGTAITIEIATIRDYIAAGTNTIAITTITGRGIMTGIATAITIATVTMTKTKIMTMIANSQPE